MWYNVRMMDRRTFVAGGLALSATGVRSLFAEVGYPENPGLVHPKPEPGKIVVMQCWDDSPVTDIRMMGICRKYGAKATFNLIPHKKPSVNHMVKRDPKNPESICYWTKRGEENGRPTYDIESILVKDFAETYRGFTVAGHNYVTHKDAPKEIEWATAALKEMREIITRMGQKEAGYVWPGGRTSEVGARLVREAGFRYARTTKATGEKPLGWTDAMFVPASGEWWSPAFWKRYESVKRQGGFFWFWGHSCELAEDNALWDKYEAMIQKISADKDATWIDPIDLFVKGA